MTVRTRRLLFLSLLVAALTLPAETILVKAVQTPSQDVAIQDWAFGLSSTDRQSAASQIQSYPFAYRKAIMASLTSKGRSAIWRAHLQNYLQANPKLDATAVSAIQAVSALASPDFFDDPTAEARQSVHLVADQISSLLGRDQAEYLLYYLGPKDGTFASFVPWQMRLTGAVRSVFALKAFTGDCDCASYMGCPDWRSSCVNWTSCSTTSWGCGWFWADSCDGGCAM